MESRVAIIESAGVPIFSLILTWSEVDENPVFFADKEWEILSEAQQR